MRLVKFNVCLLFIFENTFVRRGGAARVLSLFVRYWLVGRARRAFVSSSFRGDDGADGGGVLPGLCENIIVRQRARPDNSLLLPITPPHPSPSMSIYPIMYLSMLLLLGAPHTQYVYLDANMFVISLFFCYCYSIWNYENLFAVALKNIHIHSSGYDKWTHGRGF